MCNVSAIFEYGLIVPKLANACKRGPKIVFLSVKRLIFFYCGAANRGFPGLKRGGEHEKERVGFNSYVCCGDDVVRINIMGSAGRPGPQRVPGWQSQK
jgi:hypothetical protein